MPRLDTEKAELSRLSRVKQLKLPAADPLGPQLLSFFKHSVQKRQTRFGVISECWATIIPAPLLEHCALESFHAGTLKVIVDSSTHLYALKHELLAGLQQHLLRTCKSAGLRKISLKSGRWYDGEGAHKRIRF